MAKTELEDASLETDGMASSVSKLRDELMSLTGGFDIMTDNGQTFKSTYDILEGISQVWDKMSDVSQANVLEKLAGKRNANALAAIINNFDTAQAALEAAQNSEGSALAENEKYLESLQGHLDQLTAAWQNFSVHTADAGAISGVVDIFKGLINVLDLLLNRIGLIPMALAAVSTAFIKFGQAGKICPLTA